MLRLLVKTYDTGKKYLCKSESKDFLQYRGSGLDIPLEAEVVDTEVLFETDSKEQFREIGIYYSEMWSVDSNPLFYNRCYEEGQGGNIGAEGYRKGQQKKAVKRQRANVQLLKKYQKKFQHRKGWQSWATHGVNWSVWSDEKIDNILEMLFEKYGSPDEIDWKSDGRGKASSNGKAIGEALKRYHASRRNGTF